MMKHTTSDGSGSINDFHSVEVISNENVQADENELPERHTTNGTSKPPPSAAKAGSLDRENYYLPKEPPSGTTTPPSKAKQYTRPLLPRVFLALLTILLLAVIALSLVLYHFDQELSYMRKQTNSSLMSLQSKLDKTKEKDDEEISAIKFAFNGNMSRLDNKSKEVVETTDQLDMYMQFKEHYKGKIGMTFDDVLKMNRKVVRVNKPAESLKELSYQFDQFTSNYEQKWKITYTDVLRLTTSIKMIEVGKKVPLLIKIDSLYEIFKERFLSLWNIQFKEVIRLTTVDDVKEMSLFIWFMYKADDKVPTVLQKIDYMYQEFNKTYRTKWNMTFKEIISMTEGINFNVNGSIPLFQKIIGWHFDGYDEIWGNSFPGFIQLVMKNKQINQADVLKKITYIKNQGKLLKFFPGTFLYEQNKLSVYGYVALYRNSTWETIRKGNIHQNEAYTICRTGRYSSGAYDNGAYNKGDMDRSALRGGIAYIYCPEKEDNVDRCTVSIQPTLNHTDDGGVKCTF